MHWVSTARPWCRRNQKHHEHLKTLSCSLELPGPDRSDASGTVGSPKNPREDDDPRKVRPEEDGYYYMTPNGLLEKAGPDGLVLWNYLAEVAGSTMITWRTRQQIEKATGLSEPKIRYREQKLIKLGLLAMEQWRSEDGDNAASVYIVWPFCKRYELKDLSIRVLGTLRPTYKHPKTGKPLPTRCRPKGEEDAHTPSPRVTRGEGRNLVLGTGVCARRPKNSLFFQLRGYAGVCAYIYQGKDALFGGN